MCWLAPGLEPETAVLGWVHGFTWIGLALLAAYAQRRGVLPFWLAFLVVVIGGVGPFAGSSGFVYETRRRAALAEPPERVVGELELHRDLGAAALGRRVDLHR